MNNVDGKLFAWALTLFVIIATTSGSNKALAEAPSVEILAATCAGCHGPKGNSEGPSTPTISGITQAYFILAMDQYRQGLRNSTIMKRIAKGYSWDQIRALANYFSGQPMVPLNQSYERVKARRGKLLHSRYCEQCHMRKGRDAGNAGVLAGQMVPYLRSSLDEMMTGKRPMPQNMGRWMERMLRIEGKDAIDDLMNYYAARRTR